MHINFKCSIYTLESYTSKHNKYWWPRPKRTRVAGRVGHVWIANYILCTVALHLPFLKRMRLIYAKQGHSQSIGNDATLLS